MLVFDQPSAERYLRAKGHVDADERIVVRELAGGVSNMVLLVARPDVPGGDLVLKQAREKLRTARDWYCTPERIWREADVLRTCRQWIERGGDGGDKPPMVVQTPRVLFEDREQYLLAIEAAPRPNRVWKQELLSGRVNPLVAGACGYLLGTLHAESWQDAEVARALGDRSLFEQLRIDPYYRTLATNRPETRKAIERLIDSLRRHPRSLVHADFSPKNMLLFDSGHSDRTCLMLVDFETGHYGDPAFDLGFFLSHLVLKACHRMPGHAKYLQLSEAFRESYDRRVSRRVDFAELAALWTRGIQNFAACAWARLDGKSPVDYLDDPARRELMRELCREVFAQEPTDWPQVMALAGEKFSDASA